MLGSSTGRSGEITGGGDDESAAAAAAEEAGGRGEREVERMKVGMWEGSEGGLGWEGGRRSHGHVRPTHTHSHPGGEDYQDIYSPD